MSRLEDKLIDQAQQLTCVLILFAWTKAQASFVSKFHMFFLLSYFLFDQLVLKKKKTRHSLGDGESKSI